VPVQEKECLLISAQKEISVGEAYVVVIRQTAWNVFHTFSYEKAASCD
jgi:hypothetical protein